VQANKYYVVWKGFAPGIYDSWEEAEMQVSGYPEASYRSYKTLEAATAAFRDGFDKEGLIKEVQREMQRMQKEGTPINFQEDLNRTEVVDIMAPSHSTAAPAPTTNANAGSTTVINGRRLTSIGVRDVKVTSQVPSARQEYLVDTIAVDAACSGNPGPMEYRGVYVKTGQELFRVGPLQGGTNNIGEFLAIVHGLAMQEKQGTRLPLYSDSVNAQAWVRQGVCKTQLVENEVNAPIFDMIRRAEQWLRTHTFRVPIFKWETKQWGEIPADFGRK